MNAVVAIVGTDVALRRVVTHGEWHHRARHAELEPIDPRLCVHRMHVRPRLIGKRLRSAIV
eukprot:2422608-Prymnesium_polylepis.4